ncbi:alpha/beta fold hydrolase [Acetobacter conturbans]|uniref:alpha/beta fold hydrolase n=1 Tax=Acetobacter conturbans TaxID=1737472 RepID=UPI0030D42EC4
MAFDTRGHGRSAIGTTPLTYRQLQDDCAAVLASLGLLTGIIGHSDGGIVTLRLAASLAVQPEFVVAVGAHWQLPEDDRARKLYRSLPLAQ